MTFPEEKRPIDVTTKEKSYSNLSRKRGARRPKRTKEPRRDARTWEGFARLQGAASRATAALGRAVGRGLRHPLVWVLMACLVGVLTYVRLRPPTVQGPSLPRTGWKATASSGFDPQAAIGVDAADGWMSGGEQADWYEVDMRKPQTFHQVVMQSGDGGIPGSYALYISNDGKHWGASVATGQGTSKTTIIALPKTTARYLKVVDVQQDENANSQWLLSNFTVHK